MRKIIISNALGVADKIISNHISVNASQAIDIAALQEIKLSNEVLIADKTETINLNLVRISQLEDTVNTLNEDILAVTADDQSDDAQILALTNQVSQMNEQIISLGGVVESLNADIAQLEADKAIVEEHIDALEQAVITFTEDADAGIMTFHAAYLKFLDAVAPLAGIAPAELINGWVDLEGTFSEIIPTYSKSGLEVLTLGMADSTPKVTFTTDIPVVFTGRFCEIVAFNTPSSENNFVVNGENYSHDVSGTSAEYVKVTLPAGTHTFSTNMENGTILDPKIVAV